MRLFPRLRRKHNTQNGMELSELALGSFLIALTLLAAFLAVFKKRETPTSEMLFKDAVAARALREGCVPKAIAQVECVEGTKQELCRPGDALVVRCLCGQMGSLTLAIPTGKEPKDADVIKIE